MIFKYVRRMNANRIKSNVRAETYVYECSACRRLQTVALKDGVAKSELEGNCECENQAGLVS